MTYQRQMQHLADHLADLHELLGFSHSEIGSLRRGLRRSIPLAQAAERAFEKMMEATGPRDEVIAIHVELEPFADALSHADGAAQKAMLVHVDALLHERGRAMGLSEDEIARIRRRFLAGVRQRLHDRGRARGRAGRPTG